MDPGKSRNMPLQALLASRRPSPRHFSPVSGYPSFVQAPSLLDPLRRESVGSRRLCLEADVGDVPGRVPVSRCDRESRIPGVIPDYPGLSRIKTFDRPHLRAPAADPRTASARRVDRRATGATRPWHRQRATGSRHLAVRALARTPASSRRDPLSCISDAPSTSYVDRAPAAATGPADRRCPPK